MKNRKHCVSLVSVFFFSSSFFLFLFGGYGELRHSPHNSCKNVHRCLRQPQGIRPKRLEVTSVGGKKKQREKNGGGVVEGICTFFYPCPFFLSFLHVRSWHQRVINYVVKLSLALSVPEQKTNYFPIATVANLFVPKAALSPKRSKLRRSAEKGYILTALFFCLKCRFLIRDLVREDEISVVFSLLSVHLCMDSVLQGCPEETEHCFSTV